MESAMESSGCEVIGCSADGVWRFTGRVDPYYEDILCDTCLRQLHLLHPVNAARYQRIERAITREATLENL